MNILLVEDDFSRIMMFTKWFNNHYFVVANNSKSASNIIEIMKFDFIFLDHDLGMDFEDGSLNNGFQVVKHIWTTINNNSTFIIHSQNNIAVESMSSYLIQSCPNSKLFINPFNLQMESLVNNLIN